MPEEKEKKSYTCAICGKDYKSRFGLNGHFITHMNVFQEKNSGKWAFSAAAFSASGFNSPEISSLEPEPEPEYSIPMVPKDLPTIEPIIQEKPEEEEEEYFMSQTTTPSEPKGLSQVEFIRQLKEGLKKEKEEEDRQREAKQKEQARDAQIQKLDQELSRITDMICDEHGCRLATRDDIAAATQEAAQKAAEMVGQTITQNLKKQAEETVKSIPQRKEDHRTLKEIIDCPTCSQAKKAGIINQAKEIIDINEVMKEKGYIRKEDQRLF